MCQSSGIEASQEHRPRFCKGGGKNGRHDNQRAFYTLGLVVALVNYPNLVQLPGVRLRWSTAGAASWSSILVQYLGHVFALAGGKIIESSYGLALRQLLPSQAGPNE